jgi:hypothetical protein
LQEKFVLLALATLIIGSSITPLMAQGAPIAYNVHVDFFSPFCSLSNLRITLNDQTGRVVASTVIPDAFEVTLTYRTPTPANALTATAFGQASVGSYKTWSVSGSSTITVGNGGDYWITIQLR